MRTSAKPASTISLPVVADTHAATGGQRIRPSRNGKRRAIVLAIVQGLIIAHIILWLVGRRYNWFGGETLTPVEPSESMEFVRNGMVNAGLIFFSLALLSTLILGRWFCGWGCHVVLLQDLCGWMMKKVGVRPKPFRSRLLIYVPLLLALYMFIWPAVYRWGVLPTQAWLATRTTIVQAPNPISPWRLHAELTTPDFWKTFAGPVIAVPFLLICGFATVYFLGAKGFCTYGCPYGGFFAPLDKFSPGRIRVTDACEGCGHCTAVCTSNVRVHEEVREYGMVVDPGCMKCLDCVSVCPNDALYFGFGSPAVAKGDARNEPPKRKYDLTLREELVFAGVFALTFFCTRGVYGLVPMLMAVGIAGCMTFISWKTWRLLRDANVTFHRWQLKLRGSLRPSGWVLALSTTILLALVLHSGAFKVFNAVAQWQDDRVIASADDVLGRRLHEVTDDERGHAASAVAWYRRASSIGSGGIGLSNAAQGGADVRMAWLLCVQGAFEHAEQLLRESLARSENEGVAAALAMLLRTSSETAKVGEAIELYERSLMRHSTWTMMLSEYEPWALSLGRVNEVAAIHRARLDAHAFDRISLRGLTIVLLQHSRFDEGLAAARRWVSAQPRLAEAHRWNAAGLAAIGAEEQAIAAMRLAVRYSDRNDTLNRELLAQMLEAVGRTQEAAAVRAQMSR